MLQAGGASGVRITRQTAAHLFHQVLNCDAPFELLAIRVLRLLDPKCALRRLSIRIAWVALPGQQVHLEIQMIAAIGNDADPVLLHQHKRRDQHSLKRGDRSQ